MSEQIKLGDKVKDKVSGFAVGTQFYVSPN